jgi:hypothetical protein
MALATRLRLNNQDQGDITMTSRLWRAAALLAPAVITTGALAVPAATASASPSWQLVNEFTSQPACYTTGGGTNDLEIDLNGSWSTPINIGASGLPAGVSVAGTPVIDFEYALDGSSYTVSYGTAPIPAGWSNGTGPVSVVPQPDPQSYTLVAEGYVAVAVPSGLQANSSFNITLWASDGTTTQTESVPVVIKASCKRHY